MILQTSIKTSWSTCLRPSRQKVGSVILYIKGFIPQGKVPQIPWASKNSQGRDTLKAHSFQHRDCQLWNIQRTGKDPKTPGGKISISSPEHQGLHTTSTGHKTTQRSMHHVIWCEGTVHICANTACHIYHQKIIRRGWGTPAKNQHVSEPLISLLEFCLRSTYFTFQGRFYEQQEGAAMGSPISPIVANLYMEDFEKKAINSSPHPLFLEKICWCYFHHH